MILNQIFSEMGVKTTYLGAENNAVRVATAELKKLGYYPVARLESRLSHFLIESL